MLLIEKALKVLLTDLFDIMRAAGIVSLLPPNIYRNAYMKGEIILSKTSHEMIV